MAVKQNGVLATFTPTVSKYTNLTTEAALGQINTNGWCMYTCPTATLTSAKLIVANDTGGNANIDVGIVEQTDVIQFDAVGSQPGSPSGYGAFVFASGNTTNFASSIVVKYGNLSAGANITKGMTVTWTNSTLPSSFQSCSATVHYHDTGNGEIWFRSMNHPLALKLNGDTTFTTSGGTFSVGPTYAGTTTNSGHSGNLRFYDSLTGTLFLQNYEFRNNLDYKYLYANDTNENRVQNNNNLSRSNGRIWRPVATTTPTYDNAGQTTPQATEFIDAAGTAVLVGSVSQISTEQYLVKQKQVSDNEIFELNGLVLGAYQSVFVSSTAAVSFNLMGFEEVAEVLS